jgi:hypothetical protein
VFLRLRDHVFIADVEYGTALLDETRGEYWNLNPSGVVVLQTLLRGGTSQEAAVTLSEQYDVDLETATRDVEDLLSALTSSRLVEEVGERDP